MYLMIFEIDLRLLQFSDLIINIRLINNMFVIVRRGTEDEGET